MKRHSYLCLVFLLAVLFSCSRDPNEQKKRFLDLGNASYERGDYKEASIFYRKALQYDKRYADAYYAIGRNALKLGRGASAVASFRRAYELDPDNMDAFLKLCDLYFVALQAPNPISPDKTLDSLIQIAEQAELSHPDAFEVISVKGRIQAFQKNLDEASRLLVAALQMKPMDTAVFSTLLNVLVAQGKLDEAETRAVEFLKEDKQATPVYTFLYHLYVATRRMDKAEATLLSQAENNPGSLVPWLQYAAYLRWVGKTTEAREVLKRLTDDPETYPEALKVVGGYYLSVGDRDEAVALFRRGMKEDPDNDRDYRVGLVVVDILENRTSEAAKQIEVLLERNPNDAEVLGVRGRLRMASGSLGERNAALDDLKEAVSKSPQNHLLHYHYGVALASVGDFLGAEAQFRESMRLNPSYARAQYGLVDVLNQQRDFAEAKLISSEYLKAFPQDPAMRLGLAESLIGLGDDAEARKAIEMVLKSDQLKAEARLLLASLESNQRNYAAAEKQYRSLLKELPGRLDVLEKTVGAMLAQKKYSAATDLIDAQQRERPSDRRLAVLKARVWVEAGKKDQARALLEQVVAAEPDNAEALYRLSLIQSSSGDVQAAKASLLKAINGIPQLARVYYSYGTLLAGEGDYDNARKHLQRALQLNQDLAPALNNLAFVLAESDADLDQAITYAQRAIARNPDNPDYLDTLAYVYIKRQLSSNAVDLLKKIVEQHPNKGEYHYHLGLAYFQQGEAGQAKTQLEAAQTLSLSPGQSDRVRQLLAEIGG